MPCEQAEYQRILTTKVRELTFETVKKIDVSAPIEGWDQPEQLITFAEAIRIVKLVPGSFCFAEIKSGGGEESVLTANIAAKVIRQTRATPLEVVFISFDLDAMVRVKKLLPRFRCLQCMFPEADVAMAEVKRALEAGLDGVDLWAIPDIVTEELVQYVHAQGKCVAVWVWDGIKRMQTDTLHNMHVLGERGVDYFTTDMPEDILAVMESESE